MAKVILHPIGSSVEEALAGQDYETNVARMKERTAKLDGRRAEVHEGWGPKYVERVHKKGKMTSWERIEALKDPGSDVFPINSFVNYGKTFGDGKGLQSPSAGVI
ncbi:MAG: propionyl-CoA carboxylase, partial [Deltaproteobacteria bacterium]